MNQTHKQIATDRQTKIQTHKDRHTVTQAFTQTDDLAQTKEDKLTDVSTLPLFLLKINW